MQFIGKTVDEAKALGLAELGITEENAVITVVEEPTKGLFGRLKGKAVVEIEAKKEEKTASSSENTLKFIQGVISIMGYNATVELAEGKETTLIIKGEDTSAILSHHGEILDAIQTLAGAAENIGRKDYKKVVVDCENYREKREETLVKLAKRLEEKATTMRREVVLEPMSPYERRIIHTALAGSETVTTKSDGKEPNRYVVIVPNDKDEFSKPYNAGRNDKGRNDRRKGGKGGRNDRRGGRNDRKGKGSGFIEKPKKSSSFSFGTYLGNSLKDNK